MTHDILFQTITDHHNNKLGKITLNRPQALNAMSWEMFGELQKYLTLWEKDFAVKAVLITSSSPKAFCAGGDIRAVYENRALPLEEQARYFQREYAINRQLFHYTKPYIAFMNGITMGGGVGISLNGKYRIAGTDLRFAMPETGIGFFPDVGATYHLSRLPNHIGTYLALTGSSIDAGQAKSLKLVDYIVQNDQFDELEQVIVDTLHDKNALHTALQSFHVNATGEDLPIEKINRCFSKKHAEEIVQALKEEGSAWASETLKKISRVSPLSVKIALAQIRYAKLLSFDAVIAMDLHICKRMLEQSDFIEGIRALIIDKDKNPTWQPDTLAAVSSTQVLSYFPENI